MLTAARRTPVFVAVTSAAALGLVVAGCGRSSSPSSTPSTPASSSSASASTSAAGDFGTLKALCGPGTPSGATARGLTATTIRIGVLADVGATVAPGLGQEFFDSAHAFSKWCNAAGGIGGRKIVIDKLDSQVFNVGQSIVNACQKDFMLVGGGTPLDNAGVKQRLGCKLGQIPAYEVSTQAIEAGLQVKPYPVIATQQPFGGFRLMAEKYPDSKTKGVAIGSGNSASLATGGKRTAYATEHNGYKTLLQLRPLQVDNFRPYMEELKGAGVAGIGESSGVTIAPEIQGMKNIGWMPEWMLFTYQFYNQQAVDSAKSLGTFPPSYVALNYLPFELSDQSPALKEIKTQLTATVSKPQYTQFTSEAYSSWTLFAKAATACGANLTQDCVLQKAGSETAWTGGGIQPPVSTSPSASSMSDCVAIVRLTTGGWVYDKAVTQPNKDFYNCDPKNVAVTPANP